MWWMIAVRKNKAFHAMNDSGFAKAKSLHAMNDSSLQKIKAFFAMNYSVFAKSQNISNDEWLRFAKTKHFMRWMILVRKNKSISCDEWYTFAKAKAFHAMNDSGSQKQKHFMRWMIHIRKSQSISCNEWYWFAKTKAFHAMNDSRSQKPKHFMQWMIHGSQGSQKPNHCMWWVIPVFKKQKHFMQWMIHVRKNQSISWNEWFMDHKDRKSQSISCKEKNNNIKFAKYQWLCNFWSMLFGVKGCYCWGRKSNWLGRAQKAWLTAVPLHSLFPIVEKKISEGRPCTNQTHREFDVRPYI